MKIKYLDDNHYLFGNKGAVWSDKIHIWESGNFSTTMCGTPGLSSNWAAIEEKEEAGCPECITKFLEAKKEVYDAKVAEVDHLPGEIISFSDWLEFKTHMSREQIAKMITIWKLELDNR